MNKITFNQFLPLIVQENLASLSNLDKRIKIGVAAAFSLLAIMVLVLYRSTLKSKKIESLALERSASFKSKPEPAEIQTTKAAIDHQPAEDSFQDALYAFVEAHKDKIGSPTARDAFIQRIGSEKTLIAVDYEFVKKCRAFHEKWADAFKVPVGQIRKKYGVEGVVYTKAILTIKDLKTT